MINVLSYAREWNCWINDFYVCLADFLKTNLEKFAVIWVRRSQKAGFLSLRSSKIIVTKEKERRKRKSEEKERRRREKRNSCTLSFYNSYLAEKNCSTQKVTSAITLSRISLDVNSQKLTCRTTRTLLHQTRMNQTLEGNTKRWSTITKMLKISKVATFK